MGSYERAPAGALADRDYTNTALDPEKARDLINQYRHDKGLKPLQLNAELTAAAKAHSRDLANGTASPTTAPTAPIRGTA